MIKPPSLLSGPSWPVIRKHHSFSFILKTGGLNLFPQAAGTTGLQSPACRCPCRVTNTWAPTTLQWPPGAPDLQRLTGPAAVQQLHAWRPPSNAQQHSALSQAGSGRNRRRARRSSRDLPRPSGLEAGGSADPVRNGTRGERRESRRPPDRCHGGRGEANGQKEKHEPATLTDRRRFPSRSAPPRPHHVPPAANQGAPEGPPGGASGSGLQRHLVEDRLIASAVLGTPARCRRACCGLAAAGAVRHPAAPRQQVAGYLCKTLAFATRETSGRAAGLCEARLAFL